MQKGTTIRILFELSTERTCIDHASLCVGGHETEPKEIIQDRGTIVAAKHVHGVVIDVSHQRRSAARNVTQRTVNLGTDLNLFIEYVRLRGTQRRVPLSSRQSQVWFVSVWRFAMCYGTDEMNRAYRAKR
jgi:hypothetical protein